MNRVQEPGDKKALALHYLKDNHQQGLKIDVFRRKEQASSSESCFVAKIGNLNFWQISRSIILRIVKVSVHFQELISEKACFQADFFFFLYLEIQNISRGTPIKVGHNHCMTPGKKCIFTAEKADKVAM